MKSKNRPGRRVRREGATPTKRSGESGRPVILDFIQSQIEAFNQKHGGGVFVRKDSHGYTLIREGDGMPIARLRPKTQGNFEVLYWSPFHDRWRAIRESGTFLLEKALEFIAEDPMDCFWR
jgi:hypothetical protein